MEKDLIRIEKLGTMERVKYSDWAAPIALVPKTDDTVRVCGDFKATVNSMYMLINIQYLKPKIYLQHLLVERNFLNWTFPRHTSKYCYIQMIINTQLLRLIWGSFSIATCLPFGIASTPTIF